MPSCESPQLKQLLYRHVRGELEDPHERRTVDAHIEECAECRGIFQELQWVLGSLRPTTPEEHEQLMRELRRADAPEDPVSAAVAKHGDSSAHVHAGFLHRLKHWLTTGGASGVRKRS